MSRNECSLAWTMRKHIVAKLDFQILSIKVDAVVALNPHSEHVLVLALSITELA